MYINYNWLVFNVEQQAAAADHNIQDFSDLAVRVGEGNSLILIIYLLMDSSIIQFD